MNLPTAFGVDRGRSLRKCLYKGPTTGRPAKNQGLGKRDLNATWFAAIGEGKERKDGKEEENTLSPGAARPEKLPFVR